MRASVGTWLALGLLCASAASATESSLVAAAPPAPAAAPAAAPAPLPPGAEVRPFAFTHLVAKLPPGKEWSSPHGGWFCVA